MSLVVNLFGGPGVGKSAIAFGLCSELKFRGYDIELAAEYAKDLTWEERYQTLRLQPYVFGKQYHRISRLLTKVEAVITDSPILLSCLYASERFPEAFHGAVYAMFCQMDNLNFCLDRVVPYNPNGRNETEEEAREKDREIREFLDRRQIDYVVAPGSRDGLSDIVLPAVISKIDDRRAMGV